MSICTSPLKVLLPLHVNVFAASIVVSLFIVKVPVCVVTLPSNTVLPFTVYVLLSHSIKFPFASPYALNEWPKPFSPIVTLSVIVTGCCKVILLFTIT